MQGQKMYYSVISIIRGSQQLNPPVGNLNFMSKSVLQRQQLEKRTHSLGWHLPQLVADPSTAAAIAAVSALPETAERTEMIITASNINYSLFFFQDFFKYHIL